MPTYQYKCAACEKVRDIKHSISEADSEHLCPLCEVPMSRVFTAVPAHFIGSGFASNAYKDPLNINS